MTTTDFIQIIGTAAFAVSGYLVGYSKRLDVLGVVITALLTAVGGGMMRDALVGRIPQVFLRTDAIGLAAFSITGAQIGIGLQLNLFGVIVLAFVTAVGGGIARDILVNDVPIVLRADLYGSVAIFIGGLMYFLARLGWINAFTLHLLFAAGLFLRLAAYRFHWQLPGFQPRRK